MLVRGKDSAISGQLAHLCSLLPSSILHNVEGLEPHRSTWDRGEHLEEFPDPSPAASLYRHEVGFSVHAGPTDHRENGDDPLPAPVISGGNNTSSLTMVETAGDAGGGLNSDSTGVASSTALTIASTRTPSSTCRTGG